MKTEDIKLGSVMYCFDDKIIEKLRMKLSRTYRRNKWIK